MPSCCAATRPSLVYEPGERSLPVDWRRCRERSCSDAPDDRDLDAHRTRAGLRATAFTRVVRRGGTTYLQYWLYYPDSNTAVAGSDSLWRRSQLAQVVTRLATGRARYPGYHPDDWEAYAVRVERGGRVAVRASSHGHWQWCKSGACRDRWGAATGWSRVSRGSHAGHVPVDWAPVARRPGSRPGSRAGPRHHWARIPGVHMRERTTTAEGLRLVPLERLVRRHYRPLEPDVLPPWRKRPYADPEADSA